MTDKLLKKRSVDHHNEMYLKASIPDKLNDSHIDDQLTMTKENLLKLSQNHLIEMVLALSGAQSQKSGGTPGAEWRRNGQDDPFDSQYDCERACLCYGHLTDDQIANAVYLSPGIANLTAAKDRIRWLSRALERSLIEKGA